MRRLALSVVAALIVGSSPLAISTAVAYDPASTAAITVDNAGIGLRGDDPVSDFVAGAPWMGAKQFSAAHTGVIFRRTWEETGVAPVKRLDGDPSVWRAADGNLFVYVHEGAKAKFLEDIPTHTVATDAAWSRIKDKAPKDL